MAMIYLLISNTNIPHERMGIWGRRRHFCVIQVLPTLPVSIEPRREHGVTVLIQKLANQAPGLRGEARFTRAHVLLLPREGRDGLWKIRRGRSQNGSWKHNCFLSFLNALGGTEFRRHWTTSHFRFKVLMQDTMPPLESSIYLPAITYLLALSSLAFTREFTRAAWRNGLKDGEQIVYASNLPCRSGTRTLPGEDTMEKKSTCARERAIWLRGYTSFTETARESYSSCEIPLTYEFAPSVWGLQ